MYSTHAASCRLLLLGGRFGLVRVCIMRWMGEAMRAGSEVGGRQRGWTRCRVDGGAWVAGDSMRGESDQLALSLSPADRVTPSDQGTEERMTSG
ncbi:hypothetical protein BKA80DRAFT_281437 [Phyllosticta citrichinensis]